MIIKIKKKVPGRRWQVDDNVEVESFFGRRLVNSGHAIQVPENIGGTWFYDGKPNPYGDQPPPKPAKKISKNEKLKK